jgi:hypothetical protein
MRPSACVSTTLIKREWSPSGRKSGTKHFIESLRLISCGIRQLLIRISQLFINLSLGEMCECLYFASRMCPFSASTQLGQAAGGVLFSQHVLLVCARKEINLHHEIEMGKNLTVAATLSGNFPRLPPPCVCALFVSKLRSLSPHHLHLSQTSKTVCVKISKNER